MPRKITHAAPPPSPTTSEEESVFDMVPDGPYKDKIKTDYYQLKTNCVIRRGVIERAIADAKAATINNAKALESIIPEHHLNMNFLEYTEMMAKNSNEAGRPSFHQLLGDLKLETRPTAGQTKTAGKKGSDNAASMEPPTVVTTLKKKVIRMPKKKSLVVVSSAIDRRGSKTTGAKKSKASCSTRSSQRIASHSSSMVTPPIKKTAASAASGRAFTPKFDPRYPITPAQGLRKPHIGEEVFMMSKGGSPLGNEPSKECRMPTIMLPIANGKALIISSDTALDTLNLDQDIQDNLKILQKNMASIREREPHN